VAVKEEAYRSRFDKGSQTGRGGSRATGGSWPALVGTPGQKPGFEISAAPLKAAEKE